MRHLLLTRSAYGPDVPLSVNRRRLRLLAGVAARSVSAQAERDFTWLVLIDPRDPLLRARTAAIASAGVPYVLAPAGNMERCYSRADRPQGPWAEAIEWDGPTLTSRLDDDDAYAPWALSLFTRAAATADRRCILSLPAGYRIYAGRMDVRVDRLTQFISLYAPTGDRTTVMDVDHTQAPTLAPVEPVTQRPSWLWIRHRDARSANSPASTRRREGMVRVTGAIREQFPVDWSLLR